MSWYVKPPFNGILTLQYLYQELLESDTYCWNYGWWLRGILFWDTLYFRYSFGPRSAIADTACAARKPGSKSQSRTNMLGLYISQSNVETRLEWAASARVQGKTETPFSLIEERPVFGRPFLRQFTLSYRTVVSLSVCLSWLSVCPVLSVCNVGVLRPNGWMDQDETWHAGRPRTRKHCVRWGSSHCGKWHSNPEFPNLPAEALSAFIIRDLCLLRPNDWMDQNAIC